MQVISFIQQKGGVGKTTLLATLAGLMAEDGANILVIDTDAQKSALKWAEKNKSKVKYFETTDEDILENTIETAKIDTLDAIFIDTIGASSSLVSYVVGESDLVVIPFDTTETDMECAIRTIKLVARVAKSTKKIVKAIFVANRYEKRSNIGKEIWQRLEQSHPNFKQTGETFEILSGVPVRQGFKEMFTTGGLPSGTAKAEAGKFLANLQLAELIDFYK